MYNMVVFRKILVSPFRHTSPHSNLPAIYITFCANSKALETGKIYFAPFLTTLLQAKRGESQPRPELRCEIVFKNLSIFPSKKRKKELVLKCTNLPDTALGTR